MSTTHPEWRTPAARALFDEAEKVAAAYNAEKRNGQTDWRVSGQIENGIEQAFLTSAGGEELILFLKRKPEPAVQQPKEAKS